jgi:hypothetical protein
MSRPCNTKGEKRNAYRIFVGKPEEKRPLGRLRCNWKDIIKMDIREVDRLCGLVVKFLATDSEVRV